MAGTRDSTSTSTSTSTRAGVEVTDIVFAKKKSVGKLMGSKLFKRIFGNAQDNLLL
jgi:hypothetical protein